MKTLHHSVRIAQATHTGNVRSNNEDAFGWFSVPMGELILVADGIGGNAGGEVASQCAIKAFCEAMQNASDHPGEALSQALLYADSCVQKLGEDNAELRGCGTTIVVLLLTPNCAWHIHAGDSRVYKFSQGKLQQLGRDHSSVQDMLSSGLITEEQAKASPKNVITQALGGNVKANYCKPEQVAYCRGDKFLLCTDGLWGMVEDEKIATTLKTCPNVQESVDTLLQAALEAGGKDNVTLQIVECLSGDEPAPSIQEPRIKKPIFPPLLPQACILLVVIVILLGGYVVVKHFSSPADQTPPAVTSQENAKPAEKPQQTAPEKVHQPTASKQGAEDQAGTTDQGEVDDTSTPNNGETKINETGNAAPPTGAESLTQGSAAGVGAEGKKPSQN